MAEFTLTINGTPRTVEAAPMKRLLDVLREDLALTGTKDGCGEGACGACAVLMGGKLVNSCLIPVAQVHGAAVTTIEGVGAGDALHPVQRAFLTHGAESCGICTPGLVLATVELLGKYPRPTPEEMREGLAGNLCRCAGFARVFDAVAEASRLLQESEPAPEVTL